MAVVLSLAPYRFLPAKNGGQRHISLFYKYLGQFVPLITATVESNENNLAENYRPISFFSDSPLRYINPFYVFLLRRMIVREKVTHLLIEHPYMGWLAVLLKKITSVKLIVRSHNIEGLRFKALGKWWWKLLLRYEKFVHQQADYNLFIQMEDLKYATTNFGLPLERCFVLTYGIERNTPPTKEDKASARRFVSEKHNISADERIILFVGAFNYEPNRDAFNAIKSQINPRLESGEFSNYKILVCGSGLTNENNTDRIVVTGFVDDIDLYFKAADVFINPVVNGGGIKTKLVEALGWNTNAVSTKEGAIGINDSITNNKLLIVGDNDWDSFANAIVRALAITTDTSKEYYQYFYWGNISRNVADLIEA